ncbi:MAG: hypothetical protein KF752_15325 [Pirellulaceae bacterium]|nr:hypothetical protein [Pirellulaceae bacterium]
MRIETFRAGTIQEALQLVREKLGPDASVIQTREVGSRLFTRRRIEVQAGLVAKPTAVQTIQPQPNPWQVASTQRLTPQLDAGEFNQITSGAAVRVRQELIEAGVPAEFVSHVLIAACQKCGPESQDDVWMIRSAAVQAVADRLAVASTVELMPHQQRILAFVGPSGVGKTSMLAKLAWRAYRDHGCQIGMMTVDSWQSGVADPLLDYAEQVNAHVEVVSSIEQATPALQRMRECDLVLLDTAGRSPQDAQHMAALKQLLELAQPDEIHLNLPATAATSYIQSAIEKFGAITPLHLNITKLDEVSGMGHWLPVLWTRALPVNFLSYGQHTTGDLTTANARRLASILLGQLKFTLAG